MMILRKHLHEIHFARGILNKLNNLEIAFLSIFWGQILHRFHFTSKKLQTINIDLGVVCELYKSLADQANVVLPCKLFLMNVLVVK